jgi:hypothetical protein
MDIFGFPDRQQVSRDNMIRMGTNKAEAAMTKVFAAILVMLAGLGLSTARAGFRSPESLVRNVYAYYGDRSSDLSNGLPRDSGTARQFFDPGLRRAWISLKQQPYDFLVQSTAWKIGAVSISILRRQFDKTMSPSPSTTMATRLH